MMRLAREGAPAAFVALALLLGGSTSGGAIANALLQIVGTILIVVALLVYKRFPLVRAERELLWMGGALALIGVIQLIPLPAAIWANLGGRGGIAAGYDMIGAARPALPISLWPAATVSALAAIVPPMAAALLVIAGGAASLRPIAVAVTGIAAVSFVLGVAQIVGGPDSPFYLYEISNRDQLVGFFANSNHLATLGVMSLPFLAALASRDSDAKARLDRSVGRWAAMACVAGLLMIGVVIDGSVAGMALLVPSIIGSFILLRVERAKVALPIVGILILVSVAAMTMLAFYSPLLQGFASTDLSVGAGSRAMIFVSTWDGIRNFFPLGSGLGSFVTLYPQLHGADAIPTSVYVNHAHNDFLEFALETGLAGMALGMAFLAWFARQAIFAWRAAGPGARLARAASIAVMLLLAHSLVDYPGRTAALAVLFAASCAMMARPLPAGAPPALAEGAGGKRGKMLHAN